MRAPLALLGVLALTACGGTNSGLEARRTDGSQIDLGTRVHAWCGPYDPASAAAGQPRALHVASGPFPPRSSHPASYLLVSRKLSDLRRGRLVRLGADEDVATAFVLDGESGNEVASNLTGASGTVAFREASCTPGARVRVSLRAELVSENGSGGHVTVRGELRARIGAE